MLSIYSCQGGGWRPNDSAHNLRALTFQLRETFGHLQTLDALISTAPAAHARFMRLLASVVGLPTYPPPCNWDTIQRRRPEQDPLQPTA